MVRIAIIVVDLVTIHLVGIRRKSMPLILAAPGEVNIIKKVGGNESVRHFLGNRGFVPGADVMVVSEFGGNLIVVIKGTRIALAKEMAKKIII